MKGHKTKSHFYKFLEEKRKRTFLFFQKRIEKKRKSFLPYFLRFLPLLFAK
jgi:hypothetical protein